MNILHYANYGSPYEGNFIQSLMQLRKEVLSRGGQFPIGTSGTGQICDMASEVDEEGS